MNLSQPPAMCVHTPGGFSTMPKRCNRRFDAHMCANMVRRSNTRCSTSYVVHPTPCRVLFLKEFDDDRGEHFGVNHVGLTFERVAAGVWQGFGQRISGMVYPGLARTTIYNQH